MSSTTDISRRGFLKVAGLGSTALYLGLFSSGTEAGATVINAGNAANQSVELNAWVIIDTSGKVTLVDHRAEMGQGSYQSVSQILAEELEVDLNNVNIIFGKGDKKYGSQVTGGSSTIRMNYKNFLKLTATAREMLIAAAAAKWSVPHKECHAEHGHVIHKKSNRKSHYGELVVAASKLTPPTDVKLKKRSEYRLIGKPLKRLDTPMKTNGSAIFGLDKRVPGMLFAAVERNPRLRGKVKSFDASEALKVPGVQKVFKIKMLVFKTYREGVAVVANSTYAAFQGKKALKVEWDDSGFEHINTADIYKRQLENVQTQEGLYFKKQGDPDASLAKSSQKLDVIYQTPYQSHSPIEPLNCVAHYQGDKIEIWGPIQAPDWIQDALSEEMGLKRENVIVNMTFLGGGFGRKAFMDYPHEAAVISKEINAPVQVVWTREDEMTQGPYRPGITYRCEASISNGNIDALKFRMSGQNNDHWRDPKNKEKANRSTSEGFLKPYYDSIKNISFAEVIFEMPIPSMWWRSVYASTNGFAYDSFLDEVAHAASKDPMQLRRQYLTDERSQKLLDKTEEVSGWKNRKKNEGFGVAITECFEATVAQVVKVSRKQDGKVKIDKVWAVMDCGWYVNPDIVRAQVEGAIVMGLGAATMHEITFTDGLVDQRNFHSYQMPRIYDIPPIEVHIMENGADAGGVGEPGLPSFAPALTNAIFDLTGKRIRTLPFKMEEV